MRRSSRQRAPPAVFGGGNDSDDASGTRPKRRAASAKPEDPFLTELKAFHFSLAGNEGKPFKVPTFCHVELDLRHIYDEVRKRGGYEAVTATKQWLVVCRTLGLDLTGQTSAGFQMRQNYERCLLDYELHSAGKPPRSATSSDAVNKNASAGNGGVSLGVVGGVINGTTGRPTPSARPNYRMGRKEEEAVAQSVGLQGKSSPEGLIEDITEDERSFLFEGANATDYFHIRCSMVARWRFEPSLYLSVETACSWYLPRFRSLVHCAHQFLTTRGYINFGVGCISSRYLAPGAAKGAVIIVGAGMAGLAAARQLMQLGHRVVVLEGRNRAGGRVWTKQMSGIDPETGVAHGAVGEMGGSILTGTDGNPLCVLARQLALPWHVITDRCPLYTRGGELVNETTDKRLAQEHNDMLDQLGEMREQMNEPQKNALSLGKELDKLWMKREPGPNSTETDLYHWIAANLEFANSAKLETISLGQWDQDDHYNFTGDHVFLPGGNVRLVAAMARDVPVFYEHAVSKIQYPMPGSGISNGIEGVSVGGGSSSDVGMDADNCSANETSGKAVDTMQKVRVTCANGRTFEGDAVLVTVPLGVLKRDRIAFDPPLPEVKRRSIANLGFGVLNKVVLLFSDAFWDTSLDTFGYVTADDPKQRGRYFLFYNYAGLSGGALLVALVAGDAALEFENASDAEGVAGAMNVLREIFTPQGVEVPDPLDSTCVRWGSDPFAYGSYSSISVDSTGDDYDVLAQPVGQRLHFAGEATCRKYPATMHGAFISGLREAALISDRLKELNKSGQLWRPKVLVNDSGDTKGRGKKRPRPDVEQYRKSSCFLEAYKEVGPALSTAHGDPLAPVRTSLGLPPGTSLVDTLRAIDANFVSEMAMTGK